MNLSMKTESKALLFVAYIKNDIENNNKKN